MGRKTAFQKWHELLTMTGARCHVMDTFLEIEAAYGEDGRSYHTLAHIEACLHEFAPARSLAEEPYAIEFAIWFHDLFYDTHATDNEKRSADQAYRFLTDVGLNRFADSARQMVLATRHVPGATLSGDTALMVDVDLSILGQKETVFNHYEHQIRREYWWVEMELFQKERARILEGICAMPPIYHTEFFRKKYEAAAKANLERSILKLRGGL